ncbi:hypothetical protein C9374_012978 [Naegleria lovaniensis]|uniref:Lipid-binding serum glycoprotein C-terminal domain-containing protein n=1 Tax=Naegleria lovaniensis TaxID=51637 RepID=A0AA88KC34_NAELO|nr:uncharacterized protein C9374_012978 [Naegleria lovaniensis]KAG2372948.1 hypothetical protein C9374_012978 [Naegleria lovaniensis]
MATFQVQFLLMVLVILMMMIASFTLAIRIHGLSINSNNKNPQTPISDIKTTTSQLTPGFIFTLQQRSLNYMAQQLTPKIQRELSDHLNIPDIDQNVDTPVGHVQFQVQNIQVSQLSLQTPSVVIGSDQTLMLNIPGVHTHMQADWHYRKTHWPHVSDHGSVDADITISVSIGVKISIVDATHCTAQVTSVQASFSEFNLKMHGGASWLYNFFIKNFRHSIENDVIKQVDVDVARAVNTALAKALDTISLQHDLGHGIVVDYSLRSLDFLASVHMAVGTTGLFYIPGKPVYSNEPTPMSDSLGSDKMIEVFINEFVLNSAMFASSQAGILNALITQKHIPSTFDWVFNTSSYQTLIPGIYAICSNCEIQITISNGIAPVLTLDPSVGIEMNANAQAIFQIIQNNQNIVNGFALDLNIQLDVMPSLGQNNISFVFTYKNASIQLAYSKVGTFSVQFFSMAIEAALKYVVVPAANIVGTKGVPLPQMKDLTLRNAEFGVEQGYLSLRSDFVYQPSFTPKKNLRSRIVSP